MYIACTKYICATVTPQATKRNCQLWPKDTAQDSDRYISAAATMNRSGKETSRLSVHLSFAWHQQCFVETEELAEEE